VLVFIEFHNTRDLPAWLGTDGHQRVLGRCARLLVHSLDDVRHLHQHGLVENVTLLPLAVYPWTPPSTRTLEIKRFEWGLAGKMVLASYGFVRPHKGLLNLVEAMPRLLAEHPRVHLLLVCARYPAADSEQEIARIHARVEALGLGASITFETAFLPEDEALSLLRLADLIAFPYRESTESSSAAVRAGIAVERPIIVTPLSLFDSVRDAVSVLPGTSQQAITRGLSEELRRLRNADYRRAAEERARQHARLNDVRMLSARLRGLITGVWRSAQL
jgi:glycosyltransferase involved in cell wall biosynthesis